MDQTRKLKIQTKFRSRKWDTITVPEIRLGGRWLEDLGFRAGKQVQIKQEQNKLTITVHKEQKEP